MNDLILMLVWLQNIYQQPEKLTFNTARWKVCKTLWDLKMVRISPSSSPHVVQCRITLAGKKFLMQNLDAIAPEEEEKVYLVTDFPPTVSIDGPQNIPVSVNPLLNALEKHYSDMPTRADITL